MLCWTDLLEPPPPVWAERVEAQALRTALRQAQGERLLVSACMYTVV